MSGYLCIENTQGFSWAGKLEEGTPGVHIVYDDHIYLRYKSGEIRWVPNSTDNWAIRRAEDESQNIVSSPYGFCIKHHGTGEYLAIIGGYFGSHIYTMTSSCSGFDNIFYLKLA